MTDKPKPLTKAEWEATRLETYQPYSTRGRINATLAAVRKVAEDYHDVDVTGDPPREVACNPCANEILNVLDGR